MAARRARAAGRALGGRTATSQRAWLDAFVQRLCELGWVEGRTVAIERRWGEGRPRALCWSNQPWRRDSNEMASDKPGALHAGLKHLTTSWPSHGMRSRPPLVRSPEGFKPAAVWRSPRTSLPPLMPSWPPPNEFVSQRTPAKWLVGRVSALQGANRVHSNDLSRLASCADHWHTARMSPKRFPRPLRSPETWLTKVGKYFFWLFLMILALWAIAELLPDKPHTGPMYRHGMPIDR